MKKLITYEITAENEDQAYRLIAELRGIIGEPAQVEEIEDYE